MSEILSIDRIENGVAMCERDDRTMLAVPLEQLPAGIKPGDCVIETPDGYTLDPDETARRRERNIALFKKLKKGGDAT